MTSHCANPQCGTPLLHLRDGRIFQFEVKPQFSAPEAESESRAPSLAERIRHVSHFWLCGRCAATLTLAFDAMKSVVVTSLQAS